MNDYERLAAFLKFTVSKKISTTFLYNDEYFTIHLVIYKNNKRIDIIETDSDISDLLTQVKTRLKDV